MKSRFDDMTYVIMPDGPHVVITDMSAVDLIRTLRRSVVEPCTVMC